MARVNYSGYFFALTLFEERENLKSEKFPDEKFGQSFLTLK